MKLIIALFFFCFKLYATSFAPLTLEQQLEDADAVARVKFDHKEYDQLPSGRIITKLFFTPNESIGLSDSELFQKKILVEMPGGEWNGQVQMIDGAPSFRAGEDCVLFLAKNQGHIYFSNFSMGKFEFVDNDKKYLRSIVFPNDPVQGKIDWEELKKKAEEKFSDVFSEWSKTKAELKDKSALSTQSSKDVEIKVAQTAEEKVAQERVPAQEETSGWGEYVLKFIIFLVIVLPTLFIVVRKRSKNE